MKGFEAVSKEIMAQVEGGCEYYENCPYHIEPPPGPKNYVKK